MDSLKQKRFRYGTFSTAMMLFAIILFVLVNLIADEFNRSFDLTPDRIFSLSWRSHEFLETLEHDVTITHVLQLGQGTPWSHYVSALLVDYDAYDRITVQYRDPIINPALIHSFAEQAGVEDGIHDGSVIVQSGDRIRVVELADMIIVNRDMFNRPTSIRSFSFEAAITRAIHQVTLGDPTVIYYVTGSGEIPLFPQLVNFLENENFLVREVNLVSEAVPETADILLVPMPSLDWTEVKAERVLDFLLDDGRAFFAINMIFEELPTFNSVLAAYGVAPMNHMILEGDSRHIFNNMAEAILPVLTDHEINDNLRGRNLTNFMQGAIGIETLENRRSQNHVVPIWQTSRDAYARVDIEELTVARIPSDIGGPFDLAVAITDTRFVERNHETQIVVAGNLAVLVDVSAFTGIGNYQFVLDSMQWLMGQPPSIFIPGRLPPDGAPLMITRFNANAMVGIALGAMPVLCIVAGIIVWLRRRHN